MTDDLASTLAGWSQITRAATIGPWEKLGFDDIWSQPAGRHVAETMNREADAEFIVTARTAMPRLLAAVKAVLKAADRLDSGREPYGHLVNRHEAADAFRETIRAALSGTGKGGGDEH